MKKTRLYSPAFLLAFTPQPHYHVTLHAFVRISVPMQQVFNACFHFGYLGAFFHLPERPPRRMSFV